MKTREPILMSFLLISLKLLSVALETVTPARSTGSSTASGLSFPVRETCQITSRTVVVASSAANLYAIAQRGNFCVYPSSSLIAVSSTLTTAPSIKKSKESRLLSISSSAESTSCGVLQYLQYELSLKLFCLKNSSICLPSRKFISSI